MVKIKNKSMAALAQANGWDSLSELELQVSWLVGVLVGGIGWGAAFPLPMHTCNTVPHMHTRRGYGHQWGAHTARKARDAMHMHSHPSP